jgi:FkbM family methyltransferase
LKEIIRRGLKKLNHLRSIIGTDLYNRRARYIPDGYSNSIKDYLYSRFCRVRVIKDRWVYDEALGLSFDVGTDIGKELYYSGRFETPEIEFLHNIVLKNREAPIILDIGANIGVHTIAFAKMGNQSIVHAFEPSPHTREILSYNIIKNEERNKIVVHPFAVSNSSGKSLFYQTDDDAYSSLKDTKRKKIIETVEVELITIDKFVSQFAISKIDLIKIDVEGLENEVIQGGLQAFRQFRPDIIIEIYRGSNSNPDPELTIKTLVEQGYKAYVFENGWPKPFSYHSDKNYNYFFTYGFLT